AKDIVNEQQKLSMSSSKCGYHEKMRESEREKKKEKKKKKKKEKKKKKRDAIAL
ncbi:hypothetical protein H9Q74_014565, partial [Fusarium xylarioides]